MKANKKSLPRFKNEEEERDFWSKHDFTDYLDQFEPIKLDLSELKPSTKTISLRLPQSMIDDLKKLANRRDVPYQSLLKIMLSEKIKEMKMP